MMDNLSILWTTLEGDILLYNLHDPVIIHDVISILYSTFHGDGLFMVLIMLRRMCTRQWDLGIPWDVKFPPLTLPHVYLQLRRWDMDILFLRSFVGWNSHCWGCNERNGTLAFLVFGAAIYMLV